MEKIAVISGGLGDIGKAIAIAFGQQGIKVAISDLPEEKNVESQLNDMRKQGCRELMYNQVNVTSEKEVTDWLEAVTLKWGTAQIIVPNAGIVVAGSLTSDALMTEDVEKQINVNFWGSYHLAVLGAKKIKAQNLPGRIVFIGSWAAERANARISAYCISKASVRMLCKTLALELAEHNILVNEIAPGIVNGGLSKKNQERDKALLQTHLNSIPMHSLVEVEEIARHVVYLSAFSGLNITGTTLLVDGGLSLTSKMTP
jgi:NAD(P)-dependent dehydrogenase (short-subunit alcohol dehydrogenase family)